MLHSAARDAGTMEDESGKNKALGVPALMLAAGRHVIEDIKGLQARAAPWRELVDHRAVSLPAGFYDGLTRLRRNANDLGYNYFLILLALVATCLVLRPSLLLPIAGITALWLYVLRVRAADVLVGGHAFGLPSQRIALVAFATLVLHFATNVSSVLFGAVFWGVVVCAAHAALRTPKPGVDAQSDSGFVDAFFSRGAAVWTQVKGGVEAFGVPSRRFDATDQARARLDGAV